MELNESGGTGSHPEMRPPNKRRRYSPEYKLGLLAAVDACIDNNAVLDLLRRENIRLCQDNKHILARAERLEAGLVIQGHLCQLMTLNLAEIGRPEP